MTAKKKASEADSMWEEVSKLTMNVYAMSVPVAEYYKRYPVDPNVLHLKLIKPGASAAIPALEQALNPNADPKTHDYELVSAEGNIVMITRKTSLLKKAAQATVVVQPPADDE